MLAHTDGMAFPERQKFMLKNGEQQGSWSQISTHGPKDIEKRSVFTLYLQHGVKPSNGSYAYIVVPGITREETAAYSKQMPVEILANQKDLHAVEHVARKVAGAVFYAPGQVSFKSGVTVSVDKKCFILIKEDADGAFYVSAANPETPGLRLTITLSRAGKQKRVVMQFEKGIAFLGRSKTTKVVLP